MGKNELDLAINSKTLIANNNPPQSLINQIREWIATQPSIPQSLTNAQIITFLHACNFDAQNTQYCITEYYKSRKILPEMFSNRRIDETSIKDLLDVCHFAVSPVETDDGQCLIFFKLLDKPASLFKVEPFLKFNTIIPDVATYQKIRKGAILVCDMENSRFGHMTSASAHVGLMRKFSHYYSNAIPLKFNETHFINPASFLGALLYFLEKFTPKQNMANTFVHRTGWDSLHQHISPKCLPSDYGGELCSLAEMHANLCQDITNLQPYFLAEEKQRTEDCNI